MRGICLLGMVVWLAVLPAFGQAPQPEETQPELPEESGPVRVRPASPVKAVPGEPEKPAVEAAVAPPAETPQVETRPSEPEEVRRLSERMLDLLTTDTGTNRTEFLRRIQLQNEFRDLRGSRQQNQTTLRVDYPFLGRDGLIRVDVPFLWFDPNTTGEKTSTGLGDVEFRAGYRLVDSPGFSLFGSGHVIFPTASDSPLGDGKYVVAPGLVASFPVPEINTNFFPLVEQFWSVGGDPSGPAVSYTTFDVAATTPWTTVWWTTLEPILNVDWTQNGKTTMNVQVEVGRTLGPHYRTWVRGGAGLWGENVPGAYDWLLQVGVRYMF